MFCIFHGFKGLDICRSIADSTRQDNAALQPRGPLRRLQVPGYVIIKPQS
jgi:hypothetical protein